jgi:t-SNARE complex subunit (syntaxin)
LTWLIGIVEKFLLEWLWGKILAVYSKFKKDTANREESEEQAKQETKKSSELKPDSTEKEVSDAINDTLKHF